MERLLAERGGHLGFGDQLQPDRQRPEAELRGEILRGLDREPSGDLRAVVTGDPVRVLLEVDRWDRDQLVVQRHGEVLDEVLAEPADQIAAVGDLRGHSVERATARRGEPKGDVRLAGLIGRLLRVGDVVAEQRHVVLEHVELGGGIAEAQLMVEAAGGHRLDDGRALLDHQDLPLRARHPGGQRRVQLLERGHAGAA